MAVCSGNRVRFGVDNHDGGRTRVAYQVFDVIGDQPVVFGDKHMTHKAFRLAETLQPCCVAIVPSFPDAVRIIRSQGSDVPVSPTHKLALERRLITDGLEVARIKAGRFLELGKVRDLNRAVSKRHQPCFTQVA